MIKETSIYRFWVEVGPAERRFRKVIFESPQPGACDHINGFSDILAYGIAYAGRPPSYMQAWSNWAPRIQKGF